MKQKLFSLLAATMILLCSMSTTYSCFFGDVIDDDECEELHDEERRLSEMRASLLALLKSKFFSLFKTKAAQSLLR